MFRYLILILITMMLTSCGAGSPEKLVNGKDNKTNPQKQQEKLSGIASNHSIISLLTLNTFSRVLNQAIHLDKTPVGCAQVQNFRTYNENGSITIKFLVTWNCTFEKGSKLTSITGDESYAIQLLKNQTVEDFKANRQFLSLRADLSNFTVTYREAKPEKELNYNVQLVEVIHDPAEKYLYTVAIDKERIEFPTTYEGGKKEVNQVWTSNFMSNLFLDANETVFNSVKNSTRYEEQTTINTNNGNTKKNYYHILTMNSQDDLSQARVSACGTPLGIYTYSLISPQFKNQSKPVSGTILSNDKQIQSQDGKKTYYKWEDCSQVVLPFIYNLRNAIGTIKLNAYN